jgi:hypothetical protein
MESAALGRDETPAAMLRGVRAPDTNEQIMRARLVRARFEALAEWGIPLGDASEIAQAVTVDIVEVVGLLRRGCPSDLVLEILV